MQQRQPETRNEIFNAEDLIDGRGTIPIHISMDGGADGGGQVVKADVVELLPIIPDDFFISLIQLAGHIISPFTFAARGAQRDTGVDRTAYSATDAASL